MNYSYVMGVRDNILELEKEGFIIEKDNDDYMVSFPNDKSKVWEKFIIENLDNGYWNEYIGNDIIFIFKFEDGKIKKYILDNSNEKEILKLCCEFAQTEFDSIRKMLEDNEFYMDKLK